MKNGLGWISNNHELVNHPYTVQNNFSVYRTDKARKEASERYGRYKAWAFLKTPSRKKEVHVSIGFDVLGNYQTSSINYDRGYFSKKEKESLYETLISWLIEDGWAVEEQTRED